MNLRIKQFLIGLCSILLLAGCAQKEKRVTNFQMGDRVDLGTFSYVVVESAWLSQLGEGFEIRSAQNRFLMLTLSVTNRGSAEAAVPMLVLQGPDGQEYRELENGTGVANWMGIVRNVAPAQNLQGRILFDVPLSSFRLRLPDMNESGYDQYSYVEIPLRIDSNEVQAPLPDLSK